MRPEGTKCILANEGFGFRGQLGAGIEDKADLAHQRRGKGTVAVKYRDPKNSANTRTGRGRMPRWMAAATKGGKSKKEDFAI